MCPGGKNPASINHPFPDPTEEVNPNIAAVLQSESLAIWIDHSINKADFHGYSRDVHTRNPLLDKGG
jgi:hypothetical protein